MTATFLIFLTLGIQIYESAPASAVTGSMFSRLGPEEQLRSPIWDELAKKYENIVVVLPNEGPVLYPTNPDFAAPEGSFLWREIGVFAVRHHMKLNSFYFSREPVTQNHSEARVLTEVVNLGDYRSDTLYVFIDSQMWEIAKVDTESSLKLMVLDSVPILAPAGF